MLSAIAAFVNGGIFDTVKTNEVEIFDTTRS